jgi:hypothetical protein
MSSLPVFDRYIGIDYSGAQTPASSLKGLRVYMADRSVPPTEVPPPPKPAQVLDAARHCRMAGGTPLRSAPYAGWNRPWMLISAAVFR